MASEPLVRVAEVAGRGRALVAARHIKPGEVILADSPILLYPNSSSSSSSSSAHLYCSHCFRSLPRSSSPLLPCPSCPGVRFCSPRCLSLARASSHSPALCLALSGLPHDLPPDLRSYAVFLLHAYNLAAISPPDFHRLLSLAGSPAVGSTASLHTLVASLLPAAAAASPDTTAALLAKDRANAFGLMEPFREEDPAARGVRAYGIYPRAALFNHDCLPNACRFDYVDGDAERNTDITVRALHDIPEGREVCLSYFPVNWSYKERQRRLAEDYGFLCECDRCRVEKTWKDDDDDDDETEETMEEEEGGDDEAMDTGMEEEHNVNGEEDGEDGDFPHAYFFVRYLCDRENCGGTLAPLPLSPQGTPSHVMECNVCGRLRTEQDIGEDGDGAMLDA